MLKQSNKVLFMLGLLLAFFLLGSAGVYYAGAQAQGNNTAAAATPSPNGSNSNNTNNGSNILDYGQLQDEGSKIQKKSYESTLYKVNIDTFEEAGNWSASAPSEFGSVMVLPRQGAPAELLSDNQSSVLTVNEGQNNGSATQNANQQQPQGQGATTPPNNTGTAGKADQSAQANQNNSSGYFVNSPDSKKEILGVKLNFYGGRKASWMRIDLNNPLPLSGVVKGFEVWVAGRDLPHHLYMIVEDQDKKEKLIDAGSLNFLGWRKVVAQVPFYIKQVDTHRGMSSGIEFKGFLITFDLANSYGDYYIYFDNLSAEVSRYTEENLLGDNPKDNW